MKLITNGIIAEYHNLNKKKGFGELFDNNGIKLAKEGL